MKIVHLIDYFQPQIGYQETFLAKQQIKMGHAVCIVTSDRYFPFPYYENSVGNILGKRYIGPKRQEEEGISTIRLSSIEIPKTNVIYLRNLESTLSALNPDFILCHGVYSFTSYRAARYKKKLRTKLIYDTHASSFNTNFSSSIPKRAYHFIFKHFFSRKIIKAADKIFAVGDDEQEFIIRDLGLSKSEIPIIRLGVETEIFKFSEKDREKMREKLKIDSHEIVIVYAGKITRNKDVHILIHAFKNLKNERIKILLIGGGEEKYVNVIKMISKKKNIIHIPFLKNKELPLYYSAADIGVWPGNFSITIYEALSCGLPTIVSRMKSTEFLVKNNLVHSFTRGDVQDLESRIHELILSNKLNRRNIYASSFIKKQLSWTYISQGILAI